MATAAFRRLPLGFRSRAASPASSRRRRSKEERPLWQDVALLYAVIVFLAALLISTAFLIAYLVVGSPY